jgi:hypothetical protein
MPCGDPELTPQRAARNIVKQGIAQPRYGEGAFPRVTSNQESMGPAQLFPFPLQNPPSEGPPIPFWVNPVIERISTTGATQACSFCSSMILFVILTSPF